VVFYDPPFPLAQKLLVPGSMMFKSLERLASEEVTTPDCLLVLRIPERFTPELPDVWQQEGEELAVGAMRIRFFEKPRV
ncbi:MAG: 16S rRNA (guanine(966)-N(2))-methyltransferase RsmD, partial [Planctomyces sp.]|nr:16S rRNA (guanine(966)-N(2))-methyltransferase RsmD [Planctomyces sp.]